ncbi:MAG: ACP S-malonyltransferase [Flavobacteriaceae bacterium]|jgi:[acyl-carrier-protein] S-malonyltransferase
MKAYVFPGQGAQFPGMGKELYETSSKAKERFHQANEILGFDITKIMFGEDAAALKETKVTQPAIFLHATIQSESMGVTFKPEMVAGHSLGEFSALVAAGVLSFEEGLSLVSERALAMQEACNQSPGTMAAILGLEDEKVEAICKEIEGIVIPANYNCPGQLVISGAVEAVENACEAFKEAGARRALLLPVGGAFHSPLMEPAKERLAKAIEQTTFNNPRCSVYQNVTARGTLDPEELRKQLVAQLTAPVKWTQSIQQMIADGATHFTEVGPGNVLQGLIKKIDRSVETTSGV